MVLYKRKQVKFIPPPDVPQDLSTQVWLIPQTKEWFLTYDEYLARLDYYNKRKFVCEITGNSCLTFFEARQSELKEIEGVEKNFPEALREHILRFLQFNRITRLDQLVDKVYLVFKNDYFPGETIFIKGLEKAEPLNGDTQPDSSSNSSAPSTAKQRGIIREKVQYGQTAQTKYLVVRLNDQQQAIVTGESISRDRNHFTKWLIKTFIKLTMSRSHKVGAPWVVKTKYAIKYRIPQQYPEDLKHFADSTPTGEILYQLPKKSKALPKTSTPSSSTPTPGPTDRKKKVKEESKKKSKQPTPGIDDQPIIPAVPYRKKFPLHYLPEKLQRELEAEEQSHQHLQQHNQPQSNNAPVRPSTPPIGLSQLQPTKKNIVDDLELRFDLQNPRPKPRALALPENAKSWNSHLVSEFKDDREEDDSVEDIPNKESEIRRLSRPHISSIQDALQAWTFINIYHSVLNIDTFTFDDFVYAMGWNLDQFTELGRCELLDEIWCAILSAIVSNEIPTNKQAKEAKENDEIFGLNIIIPEKSRFESNEEQDADQDGENNDDEDRGSDSEDETKVLKIEDEDSGNEYSSDDLNGTKKAADVIEISSQPNHDDNDADDENQQQDSDSELSLVEIEDDEEEKQGPEAVEYLGHNAYTCMNYRNTPWHDRLRKRNFKDGNWQCILLGVLSLVEFVPQYKPIIEQVYSKLAPKSMPATPSTVLNQFYEELDIDLKLQTLNIIIDLVISSPMVRNYIDECLEASTSLRRTRLDNIKDYKQNLEIAQRANLQIFEKLKQLGEEEKRAPRLNYSSLDMTEAEAKVAESDPEVKRQCELRREALIKLNAIKRDKKAIEQKLTELDCQRVKLLGKDRLYNRYWWFENNGLPTLHAGANDDDENDEGDETTAAKDDDEIEEDKEEVQDETYLMGRLWVQGPSNDDLLVYYKSDFNVTEKFNQELRDREYHERMNHATEPEIIDLEGGVVPVPQEQPSETISAPEPEPKEPTSKRNQIREMNFTRYPPSFKSTVHTFEDLDFRDSEIFHHEELILDNEGTLVVPVTSLSPLQRKLIEESPDPLINGSSWRYYDLSEDITKLMTWLNPWGKRESNLRKELGMVKDAIMANIEARRKALWLDDGKLPPEEVEIENDLSKLNERLEKLRAENDGVIDVDDDDDDDDDDEVEGHDDDDDVIMIGSKRRTRSTPTPTPKVQPKPKRRKKVVLTVEDALEFGEEEDLVKLIEKLKEEFEEKREERELNRVVQWVNSKAIDLFGKSLYDGGERLKSGSGRKSGPLRKK